MPTKPLELIRSPAELFNASATRTITRRGHAFIYPAPQVIDRIVLLWRRRKWWQRIEGDYRRHLLSLCREICRPDHMEEWIACVVERKTKHMSRLSADAKRLLACALKGRGEHPRYFEAVGGLDEDELDELNFAEAKVAQMDEPLIDIAQQLGVWQRWGQEVRGIGPLNAVGVLAECPQLHEMIYWDRKRGCWGGVAKVWKLFGLGVFDGRRQHRIRGKEGIHQGYADRRKIFAFNLAQPMIRDGSTAYREVYDHERAKKLGVWLRDDGTEYNGRQYLHAVGVTAKAVLRDYWKAYHQVGQEWWS